MGMKRSHKQHHATQSPALSPLTFHSHHCLWSTKGCITPASQAWPAEVITSRGSTQLTKQEPRGGGGWGMGTLTTLASLCRQDSFSTEETEGQVREGDPLGPRCCIEEGSEGPVQRQWGQPGPGYTGTCQATPTEAHIQLPSWAPAGSPPAVPLLSADSAFSYAMWALSFLYAHLLEATCSRRPESPSPTPAPQTGTLTLQDEPCSAGRSAFHPDPSSYGAGMLCTACKTMPTAECPAHAQRRFLKASRKAWGLTFFL